MISVTTRFNSLEILNRRRLILDLCGPYAGEDIEPRDVRCYLQIAGANLPVDISEALVRSAADGAVVLHLPGERMVPVETAPLVTDNEQKLSSGWCSEMEDFDRF